MADIARKMGIIRGTMTRLCNETAIRVN
ncbi:hypothetical protein [Vibrio cionasavignyae]